MVAVVYGLETQAQILTNILRTHGLQLETVQQFMEADDSDEEESDLEKGHGNDEVVVLGGTSHHGQGSHLHSAVSGAAVAAVYRQRQLQMANEFRSHVLQSQSTSQEAMRQQIDELFTTFKSFDSLPESEPSNAIPDFYISGFFSSKS